MTRPSRSSVAADTLPLPLVGLDSSWMDRGSCVGRLDLPWVSDADQVTTGQTQRMAQVCGGCGVRAWCDAYARDVTAGFWAGRHRDDSAPRAARDGAA